MMDLDLIRHSMVLARGVLITAYNEEYQQRDAETRKTVLERCINRLSEAIDQLSEAIDMLDR